MGAFGVFAILAFAQVTVGYYQQQNQWNYVNPSWYQNQFQQGNDYKATQALIQEAKACIDPVFDGALQEICEIADDCQENREQAQLQICDAYDDCANAVIDIAAELGVADCQCLTDAKLRISQLSENNKRQGLQCVEAARQFGAQYIAKAKAELENDRLVAKQQLNWGCEQLSMCANSQYASCEQEKCQIQDMKTKYVAQANEDIKKGTYAQIAEAERVGLCVVSNKQCKQALYDQARAAVQACQYRGY